MQFARLLGRRAIKGARVLSVAEKAVAERVKLLDQYRQAGAVFNYPDGLLPEEWEGLAALNMARQKALDLPSPDKP